MYRKVKLTVSDSFIEKANNNSLKRSDVVEEMKSIGINGSDIEKIIRLDLSQSLRMLTVTYKEA